MITGEDRSERSFRSSFQDGATEIKDRGPSNGLLEILNWLAGAPLGSAHVRRQVLRFVLENSQLAQRGTI